MNVTRSTRLVREGVLLAEVRIDLLEDEGGWSPYLSLDDRMNSTTSEMR